MTNALRDALQSLYEMTSRYAISDSDYGIVCNAAAALAAADATDQGQDESTPFDEDKLLHLFCNWECLNRGPMGKAAWEAIIAHVKDYAARPAPIGAVAPERTNCALCEVGHLKPLHTHYCDTCGTEQLTSQDAVENVGLQIAHDAAAPAAPIAEVEEGLFCTCVTCGLCKALNTHAAPENANPPPSLLDTIERERVALEEALHALIVGCPQSSQPKAWEAHHKAIATVTAALKGHQSVAVDGAPSTNSAAEDTARIDWLGEKCTGASDSERYLPFRVYWGNPGATKGIRVQIDKARATMQQSTTDKEST